MPVRQWRLSKDDEDTKNLEETIFLYAKKNLAVVNVYIKVFLLTHRTLEIDEVVKQSASCAESIPILIEE